VVVRDHELEDDYIPHLAYMIRGEITVKDKTMDIQLMIGNAENPTDMQFLYSFHSSCVQSFIGAHAACHLYGRMASRKLTYQWFNNTKTDVKKECAAKYIRRGFSEVRGIVSSRGFDVRNADDGMSTALLGFNYVNAPEDVVACHVSSAASMTWCQTPWGTEQMVLPIATKGPFWTQLPASWINYGGARCHRVAMNWNVRARV
jgi:hypothetical protein